MWGLLPEQERRYLVTGVLTTAATIVAAVVLWASPLSPVSLDRTAAVAASGDEAEAVSEYLDLAYGWGPSARRGEALWRAAVLTHVGLGEVEHSAEMLEDLVVRFPSHRRVADAHARMGMIHREHHGDPVRAGMRWVAGASVNPAHPDAGRWMLNAGIAFADAGDLDSAHTALSAAASRPDQAVAARLAEGRLHLITDPAQAYADYDAAFRAGATGDSRRLARLGMATALEHLDRREQALAELDDAVDGSDRGPALRRRRDRLAARRVQ
jgi:tetratricopeptide (TPR) repeat protein